MEPMKLVPLPSPNQAPAGIRIDGERLVIERLVVADASIAAFVGQREPAERAMLVERALRIGLTALQEAGVSVNVDHIRREFEALLAQTQAANERAGRALEDVLRQNFADGDGRLPRTLEKFLGDKGQLRGFVTDLFDEGRRDSAIGRMKTLLGTYFDGDASHLALLLDPTRMNSPLHQFRTEVSDGFAKLNDRLTAIEAAATARADERSHSAAKGGDFEDVLAAELAELARGAGDLVERTSDEHGDVLRSKKGDFVLSLNPDVCHGADIRIVIEAKDRAMSGRAMREELREAKLNRGASVGLVVFTPAHAPAGIAPFDIRAGDVYCVIDPAAPDRATIEAAVRLARLLALVTRRDAEVEVDAAAIKQALTGIREQLELVRRLKAQLTSISGAASQVSSGLDSLREGVLSLVAEAEAELRAVQVEARAG